MLKFIELTASECKKKTFYINTDKILTIEKSSCDDGALIDIGNYNGILVKETVEEIMRKIAEVSG